MLARIRYRGGRGGEDRLRAVVVADALEAPHHVRHVAPEDPAVGVYLVDDDEAEAREERAPLRMVRKDPRMEHVGIREEHLRFVTQPSPERGRRVAVVGARFEAQAPIPLVTVQNPELILRERLRGIEVERPALRLLEQPLEHRDVVAEGLAARRRCHDDDVGPLAQRFDRIGLVRVELLYPGPAEDGNELFRQRPGELPVLRPPRGDRVPIHDLALVEAGPLDHLQELCDVHCYPLLERKTVTSCSMVSRSRRL
jgi:hypothetical protein